MSKPLTCVKAGKLPQVQVGGMNERPLMDATSGRIVSLEAETRFAANGIVSRTLCGLSNLRVTLFGFAEGQEMTEHSSTQNALVQILSGECEFTLDGKAHTLREGDLLFMPASLPHSVRATKQFSMLLTLSKPG